MQKAHTKLSSSKELVTSALQQDAKGDANLFVSDKDHNNFNIVSGNHWFQQKWACGGGVTGAVIGVSDMEQSMRFYQWLLNIQSAGYDKVVADESGQRYRKVLLQKTSNWKRRFRKIIGNK